MSHEDKKVSAAQRKAADKYLEKFDEIRIRVPKGKKEAYRAAAAAAGESMNGFIVQAIEEKMEGNADGT